MELVDWLTVGTILLVLWTFVPRDGRAAIGAGVRWVLRGAWEVILISVGRDPSPASTAPTNRRPAYRGTKVQSIRARSARSNAPNATLPQPDAAAGHVQHSRSAFGVRDDRPAISALDLRLPQNVEELQRLARAITIHAQSPRGAKQQGILEAWGARPGGGPDWARASALFDLAVPPKIRGGAEGEGERRTDLIAAE